MIKVPILISIVLLVVLCSGKATSAEQISCETTRVEKWWGFGGKKVCGMYRATTIDSNDTTITPDSTIDVLYFGGNKKISFLPVQVSQSFPNLEIYTSWSCSIKTIDKVHFKDLKALKNLGLNDNLIETIASDSFEDLISLEVLNLKDNKIKSMNGQLFLGLNKLTSVILTGNKCIDERFDDDNRLLKLSQVVTNKCGLTDGNDDDAKLTNEVLVQQHK